MIAWLRHLCSGRSWSYATGTRFPPSPARQVLAPPNRWLHRRWHVPRWMSHHSSFGPCTLAMLAGNLLGLPPLRSEDVKGRRCRQFRRRLCAKAKNHSSFEGSVKWRLARFLTISVGAVIMFSSVFCASVAKYICGSIVAKSAKSRGRVRAHPT